MKWWQNAADTHTHIYIYTQSHIYIWYVILVYTYMQICIYIYTYANICIYIYIYICKYVYIYIYLCLYIHIICIHIFDYICNVVYVNLYLHETLLEQIQFSVIRVSFLTERSFRLSPGNDKGLILTPIDTALTSCQLASLWIRGTLWLLLPIFSFADGDGLHDSSLRVQSLFGLPIQSLMALSPPVFRREASPAPGRWTSCGWRTIACLGCEGSCCCDATGLAGNLSRSLAHLGRGSYLKQNFLWRLTKKHLYVGTPVQWPLCLSPWPKRIFKKIGHLSWCLPMVEGLGTMWFDTAFQWAPPGVRWVNMTGTAWMKGQSNWLGTPKINPHFQVSNQSPNSHQVLICFDIWIFGKNLRFHLVQSPCLPPTSVLSKNQRPSHCFRQVILSAKVAENADSSTINLMVPSKDGQVSFGQEPAVFYSEISSDCCS